MEMWPPEDFEGLRKCLRKKGVQTGLNPQQPERQNSA